MKHTSFIFFILLILGWSIATAAVENVAVINYAFVPETLTIFQGDTALWINQSPSFHTTTSGTNGIPDSIWDSGLMAPGDSFMFHFTATGDYPYFCTPHWQMGMVGLISVIATKVEETKPYDQDISVGLMGRNPTRTNTPLAYRLTRSGAVKGRIVNSSGMVVRNIVEGLFSPGEYTVIWDLKDNQGHKAAAGIYFYEIEFEKQRLTHKIILIE